MSLLAACLLASAASAAEPAKPFTEDFSRADLPAWTKLPKGLKVKGGKATLQADEWSYLLTRAAYEDVRAELKFTVLEPARNFRTGGHGGDWNAYKYHAYDDLGYEVGVLLRAKGAESGYRVQLSTKYQEVALLKYPTGSFLRVVPCALKPKRPYALEVSARANEVVVKLDGKELISYADHVLPLKKGHFGVGTSGSARVAYEAVKLTELPRKAPVPEKPHAPDFRVRSWRGQDWVFDGAEPILLLFTPGMPYNQNVKLKPGFRPVLLWNADWGVSNGGELKDAVATLTQPEVEKKGVTLQLRWRGKNAKGIYETRTTMVIGYDPRRKTYTYDVDSSLEVFKDFEFRYGFDFEHHTPLGPFYSKYLVVKNHDGKLHYRPVYPIDPGPISNLARKGGLRLWYGRTNEPVVIASPAVEYDIPESEKRQASTAVCACMYDTGIGFPPETARAGTRIAVRYRYTGYPPEEAERVFRSSTAYPMPSLDPNRHLIFAEYPKTTFKDFLPLDRPWWGKRPFTSGPNRLPPRYYLEKKTGFGSGYAMRLGPGGECAASLPTPEGPLPKGKYVVSAYARGDNLIGPGGYIDVLATDKQLVHGYTGGDVRTATKVLKTQRHHLGNGTFGWKRVGFVTEVPSGAAAIAVGLGNAGTGDVLFTDLEVRPLKEGEKPPEGVAARAAAPPPVKPPPKGALADYRMEEGKGGYVHDHAGRFGPLELHNVEWVKDGKRRALKFADHKEGRGERAADGSIAAYIFRQPYYREHSANAVFALAGALGGGTEYKAFSLCVEAKPSAHMHRKPGYWGTDLVGLGGRALKLLVKDGKIGVLLNFEEYVLTDVPAEPGKWVHLAVTGEAKGKEKLRVRIYVNGKLAREAVSKKFSSLLLGNHLVVGAELYYLEHGFYGGLIGRLSAYGRALSAAEVAALARGVAR
jgi:hypothetical protein